MDSPETFAHYLHIVDGPARTLSVDSIPAKNKLWYIDALVHDRWKSLRLRLQPAMAREAASSINAIAFKVQALCPAKPVDLGGPRNVDLEYGT